MKNYLTLLLLLVLASCNSKNSFEFVRTPKFIVRSEISTSSATPIHTIDSTVEKTITAGEIISLIDNIDNYVISYPADYPADYPIFMSDMSIERLSSSCASSITGVSKVDWLSETNGNISWGRVDAFDLPMADFPPGTQPLCRPPILEWDYDESKGGVIRLSNDAAYALCSEKDGKTVLICISQITDNPSLAEQIFSTFRWTE